MIQTTLKIIARNYLKNSSYSLVITGGLIAALTTAILLLLWVDYELSFDRYDPDNDRVYSVLIHETLDGSVETYDETAAPLLEFLAKECSDVEAITRFDNTRALLSAGAKSIQKRGAYADSGYFQVFKPRIAKGSKNKPLPDDHSVAISEILAQELFPNDDALGKFIQVDLEHEYKVSAVFTMFPINSSLRNYHFILPYDSKKSFDEWVSFTVKLREGSNPQITESLVDKKLKLYYGNANSRSMLFPLSKWRLYWNFENGKVSGGRIVYVMTFAFAGIFILLMGCANHINITTAMAMKRAREIGVRKVSGATRLTLIRQFLIESVTVVSLSAVVSVFVAWTILPLFNELTQTQLSLNPFDLKFIVGLVGIVCFTALLSGTYPAFILSSLKPVRILKGQVNDSLQGSTIRKSLVVFQLSLSVILIFAAVVLRRQTEHMRHIELGFDKSNVINVWLDRSQKLPLEQLRSEIAAHTSVVSAGLAGASPMEINGSAEVTFPNSTSRKPLIVNGVSAHYDMIPTLGIKLMEGRNFSREYNESNSFIITQKAAGLLGLEHAVGETIHYNMFGDQTGKIIGVIADFQNEDIHLPVDPVILTFGPDEYLFNLFIRYREGQAEEAITHVKAIFEKYQPGIPLEFSFLDRDFENQFFQERLLNNLSAWSTMISVIIACLGVFGLAMFNAQRKNKEIGIRKVLGASTFQAVKLVLDDLLRATLLALIIALPASYIIMQAFLEHYVYRIQISSEDFGLVAVATVMLLIATTLKIALHAAKRNPAEVIKAE